MAVTLEIRGGEKLVQRLRSLPDQIQGEVKVAGPRAAMALVWEWGSARITKPGPKTTWGTNPNGDRVVLTLTAPEGYIRAYERRYLFIIKQEFLNQGFSKIPLSRWPAALQNMMKAASELCANEIRRHAPKDTGELAEEIQATQPGEQILQTGSTNIYGSTEFNLGENWL